MDKITMTPKRFSSVDNQRRYPQNAAGFSILEAVMGMAILSIGLLAVGLMQTSAVQVNAASRDLTRATIIAQDQMESLLSRRYNDIALQTDGSRSDGIYQINWTITANSPVPNTRRVVVQVNWTSRGEAKSVQLTGVRARLQ